MTLVDERILEYLNENEYGSPDEFYKAAGMDYHSSYYSERAGELAEHGLIQRISPRGVFRITEKGEAYLAEEYDARSAEERGEEETDGGVTVPS